MSTAAGNPFLERQLDALRMLDRELICLYAEACFLSLQFIQGAYDYTDKLDTLMDLLSDKERRFKQQVEALRRIGVNDIGGICLSDAERVDWFSHCLTGGDRSVMFEDVFRQSDLASLLDEMSAPLYAAINRR